VVGVSLPNTTSSTDKVFIFSLAESLSHSAITIAPAVLHDVLMRSRLPPSLDVGESKA
jgi:hypothetical protein